MPTAHTRAAAIRAKAMARLADLRTGAALGAEPYLHDRETWSASFLSKTLAHHCDEIFKICPAWGINEEDGTQTACCENDWIR